mmetsp:Transcript_53792/g.143121  ORF Transcript_53792/g.143121 Transcript_53792/m.143121 type:complete len:277 (+) Transcript_53792:36-866(+)
MVCACCVPGVAVLLLVAAFLGLKLFGLFALCIPSKKLQLFLSWAATGVAVLVGAVGVFLGVAANNQALRKWVFAQFIAAMQTEGSAMRPWRCGIVGDVAGDLLEIGPGPASNFVCWENNTEITSWIGIEPNTYFEEHINETKTKFQMGFPTSLKWYQGEHLDVPEASMDHVVITLVLCSVDDVDKVLREAKRALKIGGSIMFMEHVADWTPGLRRQLQDTVLGSFFYTFGDGCQFRETWKHFDKLQGDFDVNYTFAEAPTIWPISPQINGRAIRLS